MDTSLHLRLGQRLSLTPQLQQILALLPLSSTELQLKVQTILESNPLLEEQPSLHHTEASHGDVTPREETSSLSDYDMESENFSNPSLQAANRSDHSPSLQGFDTHISSGLKDHLQWQLSASGLSAQEYAIGMSIIDEISEEGYLGTSVEDIQLHLSQTMPVTQDDIIALLHLIQHFEPTGVGARNLQECLLLQLELFSKDTPYLLQTKHVVQHYFSLLSDLDRLKIRLKFPDTTVQGILTLIQTLDPKPGLRFHSPAPHYIVPDILAYKEQGQWQVILNPEILPSLQISKQYAPLLRQSLSATRQYLRQHFVEARRFIKSLTLRNHLLLEVTRLIVERQRAFLEYGEEAMQPLTLRDLSDSSGFHESTLSRIIAHKYLYTPRGVYALKFFFSARLEMPSGETYSATAIQSLLRELIEKEDKMKPMTDSEITRFLEQQGITLARRTVTLYREKLGIQPSHVRKLFS